MVSTVMSGSSNALSRTPGAPPMIETEAVAGCSNRAIVTPDAPRSSWALPTSTPGTSVMRLRGDVMTPIGHDWRAITSRGAAKRRLSLRFGRG